MGMTDRRAGIELVGQQAVCEALGISRETLNVWQHEGLPVAQRGGPNRPSVYDSAAVIAWVVAREVAKASTERPQDRLARAQAIRVELDIAETQRRLLPASEVEPRWRAACAVARERLQEVRRGLVARLGRCSTAKERSEAVKAAHEAFLHYLADWRPER
jgi:terminase small subunit / prophage DNA-packing protein